MKYVPRLCSCHATICRRSSSSRSARASGDGPESSIRTASSSDADLLV